MQGFNFIIRLALAAAAFLFLVFLWALVPFLNPDQDMNVTVVSIFFGNYEPSGWVRNLLLLSRGLLGMLITLYIFIPGLRFFFEFRAGMYNNTIAIILSAAMVAAFFGALVVHNLYYQ